MTNDLLENIPRLVMEEDNRAMEAPFTELEVSNCLWSMDPDKAPGLDGFSAHFYRLCWDIIKVDLLRMIRKFHQKAKIG